MQYKPVFLTAELQYTANSCYRYKQYKFKYNSIDDFIKVYFLNYSFQQHISALVMSYLQVDYFA